MRIPLATRRLALLVAAAAVSGVAACGGQAPAPRDSAGGETSTVSATETAAAPGGTLGYDAVGAAESGLTAPQVRALFGPPDEEARVDGCELDAEADDAIVATWRLDDGKLALSFNDRTGRLESYWTDAPGLETVHGISVGDSYEDLATATGDDLRPLVLGVEPSAELGVWFVEKDPRARITYDVEDGAVARILGGHVPVCE